MDKKETIIQYIKIGLMVVAIIIGLLFYLKIK
jgi:hypothetical protein